jgi:endonuclease YncB( thermonuclease family)
MIWHAPKVGCQRWLAGARGMRMTRKLTALAAASAMLMAATAHAQAVIDGDTIDYKGVVLHLWGIDAPEKGEMCADNWNAGQAAIDHLAKLMQGHAVTCSLKSADNSSRVAAQCMADGKDISAEMANAGMAWALTRETDAYTVQETNAMAQVRGVHAHPCLKAWEYRSKQLGK